ncbi:MAG: hypothetical protein U1C33_08075, partial [Candidatus Cloacimonadaceae bacterium]|nr:hypothetical protein [Candidatus Cloacimonadaceae bacterium]
PIIYYIRTRMEQPLVLVLRDVSKSMDLKTDKHTKKDILNTRLNRLMTDYKAKGYKAVFYDFADGLSSNKDNTLLNPVLQEIPKLHKLTDIHSIVLASDGWLKDESLATVKQLNLPFYVLADSSASQIADLVLASASANKFAYRNEPTLIQAEVRAENQGGKVNVALKIGNSKVAEKSIEIAANTTATVDFIHRFSQTGFYNYSLEVSSDLRERSLNNNTFPGAIEVLNEKEKIYVITDQPGWDNKFIIDALSKNPRWEISHITVKNQTAHIGNKVLNSLETTNLAALVFVNNGALKLGTAMMQQITTLHNRGVGILWQGMPTSEMNETLPIRQSNIASSYQGFLSWNAEAENYPMLRLARGEQSNIPPVDYFYTVANAGAVTAVSMDNPQRSAGIVFRSVANRRSVALSFLNLWRWQMQSPGNTYQSMITNMITWLANPTQDSFAAMYNSSYWLGEKIEIRLRSEDEIRQSRLDISPRLEIYDEEDKSVFADFMALSKDEYVSSINIPKAGNYRFVASDRESGKRTTGRFTVSGASLEDRDFDFNLPLLSWLAFDTGGKMILHPEDYTPPKAVSREVVSRNENALYKKWYILLLFIMAFSIELFLRRRWGLL